MVQRVATEVLVNCIDGFNLRVLEAVVNRGFLLEVRIKGYLVQDAVDVVLVSQRSHIHFLDDFGLAVEYLVPGEATREYSEAQLLDHLGLDVRDLYLVKKKLLDEAPEYETEAQLRFYVLVLLESSLEIYGEEVFINIQTQ